MSSLPFSHPLRRTKSVGNVLAAASLLVLAFFTTPSQAEPQPDRIRVCSDLLGLSVREQALFLDGYIFGAAMEMKYFNLNVVSKEQREMLASSSLRIFPDPQTEMWWHISRSTARYVGEKYVLINIAFSYKADFHKALVAECELDYNRGYWLFDTIPPVLEKMRDSGKYPVQGM